MAELPSPADLPRTPWTGWFAAGDPLVGMVVLDEPEAVLDRLLHRPHAFSWRQPRRQSFGIGLLPTTTGRLVHRSGRGGSCSVSP